MFRTSEQELDTSPDLMAAYKRLGNKCNNPLGSFYCSEILGNHRHRAYKEISSKVKDIGVVASGLCYKPQKSMIPHEPL